MIYQLIQIYEDDATATIVMMSRNYDEVLENWHYLTRWDHPKLCIFAINEETLEWSFA